MSRSVKFVIAAISCILGLALAQPISFEGAVELKTEGANWLPVFVGDALESGGQLRTRSGEATLSFDDGSFLKLSTNSELHHTPTGYALIAGKAYAEAKLLKLNLADISLSLSGSARFDAGQDFQVAVFQGDAHYTQSGRVVFVEAGQRARFVANSDVIIGDYFEIDPWYQDLLVLGSNEAKVQGLSGSAEMRAPGGDWKMASSQDLLVTEGAARTGPESWLELIFSNGNIVRLQELTEVIMKTSVTLENGVQQTVLELSQGSAWLIVDNEVMDQSFQIQTPGLVAGVRGTTFRVIAANADQEALLKVFDGTVVSVTPTNVTNVASGQQFDAEMGVAELVLDAVDSFNILRDEQLNSDVPPPFVLATPLPEILRDNRFLLVAVTEPGALVEIDGSPLVLERDGSLSVLLELEEGLNEFVLDISARGFLRREVIRIESDQTPPPLNFDSPNELTGSDSFRLQGRVEVGTTIQIADRVIAVEDDSLSLELPLVEGPNVFTIRVSDRAGNSRSETYLVTRDTTPPTLRVDVVGGAITRALSSSIIGHTDIGSQVLVFSADRIVPVQVYADGSFSSHVDLNLGENSFEVQATDPAGNSSWHEVRIVRSSQAPSLDLKLPLEDTITAEAHIVLEGLTSADRLLINGQATDIQEANFRSEWLLREGRNSFVLEALDQVGNSQQLIVNVMRDSQAPEMTFFTLPQAEIAVNEANFLILAQTELNASVRLNDQAVPLSETGVLRLEAELASGENLLTFSVSDPLGNERSYVFTVTYQPR